MSYTYSMMTTNEDTSDVVIAKLREMYERVKREIEYYAMSDFIFEFGESAFSKIIDIVYETSCVDPTGKTIFGIPFIIKDPRFINPDQIRLTSKYQTDECLRGDKMTKYIPFTQEALERIDYTLMYNKPSFGECILKEANKVFIKECVKPVWASNIKEVIFNNPATIVIWADKTKTIVKAENEPFDPEKGLAMCIAKKALGNKGNYYDIFRKYLPNE